MSLPGEPSIRETTRKVGGEMTQTMRQKREARRLIAGAYRLAKADRTLLL